ncbi:MAG: hypothetical protein R3F30_16545 [Planctomycetota bacterium]
MQAYNAVVIATFPHLGWHKGDEVEVEVVSGDHKVVATAPLLAPEHK